MDNDLERLYHKQMLVFTQNPLFYHEAQISVQASQAIIVKNPMCGDWLSFKHHNNAVYWHGDGCLICRASAEALCRIIENIYLDTEKIHEICTQIEHYFNGQGALLPDKFMPLSSVKQVKSRINCVMLSIRGVTLLIKGNK
ncbi:MAG: NifU-like protein involved in Fe-S cluster formation [Alphaproteobacteria bacterium]|jgi:NifU-like protein involved in Fe-S cluster formation